MIETFHTVDKVAVAKANIRLSYDREAGYFGSSMRGSEFVMNVTEYDRILAVTSDGTYRIMAPPEKGVDAGGAPVRAVWDPAEGRAFRARLPGREQGGMGKASACRAVHHQQDLLAGEGRRAGHRFPFREKDPGHLQ